MLAITNHAVERFKQRFRLVYSVDEFDRHRILHMARNAVDTGFFYKMNPGKYNSECIRYGHPVFVLKYGEHMEFRGAIKPDGTRLITTIVRTKSYSIGA